MGLGVEGALLQIVEQRIGVSIVVRALAKRLTEMRVSLTPRRTWAVHAKRQVIAPRLIRLPLRFALSPSRSC